MEENKMKTEESTQSRKKNEEGKSKQGKYEK
jgi:hypothetical protein